MLLADNEDINRWLSEHPAVLGGIAMLIGGLLLLFGIAALVTGRSTGKYGHKMEGPMAYLHGGVLAAFGAAAVIFGLVKMIVG